MLRWLHCLQYRLSQVPTLHLLMHSAEECSLSIFFVWVATSCGSQVSDTVMRFGQHFPSKAAITKACLVQVSKLAFVTFVPCTPKNPLDQPAAFLISEVNTAFVISVCIFVMSLPFHEVVISSLGPRDTYTHMRAVDSPTLIPLVFIYR